MTHPGIDRPAPAWTGRDDGPGPEHARWFSLMGADGLRPGASATSETGSVALIGFASDEGVRRNHGRVGAAEGPAAIRGALGSLSAPLGVTLVDLGDVVVERAESPDPATGGEGSLEDGHERLGQAVASALDAGALTVVLGGGHEVAYGTYRGVAAARRTQGRRHGVFNIDAHFDLRRAARPSSGTPFLQMFDQERAAGRELAYAVAGISEANNTRVLFDTAAELGVDVLLDSDCEAAGCDTFVDAFLAKVDVVHLTIDLDVMPASVAPGVSAPAAFGVPLDVVRRMARRIAGSGRLAVIEIAELNPRLDIDGRTARLAARLVDELVRSAAR